MRWIDLLGITLLVLFLVLGARRGLWWQLVRRDLTAKYKRSVLGIAWSLLNPVFLLVIYTVAFTILGQAFERFAIWLLAGLLPWTLLSSALSTGTTSITGNAYLLGKVRFPRAILPLAAVGAAFVNFLMQAGVFAAVLILMRHDVDWAYIWLVIPALATLLLLVSALVLLLSNLNVFARDTQHFLDFAILGWFWLTPIVYAYDLVVRLLAEHDAPTWLGLLNPATDVVIAIQRGVYGKAALVSDSGVTALLPDESPWWYLRNLAVVFVIAAVAFVAALRAFDRTEGNFAEMV